MPDDRFAIEVNDNMIEAGVEVMNKLWIKPPNTPIELAAEAIFRAALDRSGQDRADRNYVREFG